MVLARNVVSPKVSHSESEPQGTLKGLWVKDGGESEGQPVMGWIGVELETKP
jgi:hypothetical protein